MKGKARLGEEDFMSQVKGSRFEGVCLFRPVLARCGRCV